MDPHWNKQRPTTNVPNSGSNSLPDAKAGETSNNRADFDQSISDSQSIPTRSTLLDCLPDGRVPETRSSQILSYIMKIFYQDNEEDSVNKTNQRPSSVSEARTAASETTATTQLNHLKSDTNKHDINEISIRYENENSTLAYFSLDNLQKQQQQGHQSSRSLPLLFTNASNTFAELQSGAGGLSSPPPSSSSFSLSSVYSTIASNYTPSHHLNTTSSISVLSEFGTNSSSLSSQTSTWPSAATLAALGASIQTQAGPTNQPLDNPYQLEALSERWQIYLAILYSLTAITSFILNVITVIVLARSHRCVLRQYLINLSMSDLLMSLFSIPFTYTEYMLGRWIFASFLCPVVRFVVTLSVFVSVATMTVIGINRHLAIMYPFRKKRCTRFREWRIRKTHVIIAIWLVGITISLPEYLMFSAEPFCYNKQYYFDCRQIWPESISNQYTVFIYLSTFAIPLLLLCYLYTTIGLKLWRRQMPGNSDANRDLTMQTMRVKVIKMLFVVVILFAISWLPLQTFSMIMFLYPEIREDFEYQSIEYNIFIGTYFACHWLSMFHSCLNPLIYCFMNDKFRSDLHDLLCSTRTVYSHYALSQSTNKSFHQAAYQNHSGQVDNSSSNNANRHGGRNQATSSTGVKSNLKSQGRSSTYTSSSSGGATSGRVARLSLRTPEGANEPTTSRSSCQVMPTNVTGGTGAGAGATTLAASMVTGAAPATSATTTKTITSSGKLPLNGPAFKTNPCTASMSGNKNNQGNEAASKNEGLAHLDLKDSVYIVNNKGTSEEVFSETKNTNKPRSADGGVFVKVFHRPSLGKGQIATIYRWPAENGEEEENNQANKVNGQGEEGGEREDEREGVDEDGSYVNSDEEEGEDEFGDEEERDCSGKASIEAKASRRAGITNV